MSGERPFTIWTLKLAEIEVEAVKEALRRAGNVVEAAERLGISRKRLKRLIVKYAIPWPASGSGATAGQDSDV